MKRFFQLFANLFQGLVGKILIIANFIICLMIFDWSKFFLYLETPARMNCHVKSYRGSGIDFCSSGLYSYGIFENIAYFIVSIFLTFFAAIFLILVYPSIAMTEIILGVLKGMFPLWCIETFDIIYIPIFAVINTFYWLFLGDMIEMAHSAYLDRKQMPEKPLSIFSGSD